MAATVAAVAARAPVLVFLSKFESPFEGGGGESRE